MGETIYRVKLEELVVVRVLCKKCQATIEIATEKLGDAFCGANGDQPAACPCCRAPFFGVKETVLGKRNRFAEFEEAVRGLVTEGGKFEIEFPVRLPENS